MAFDNSEELNIRVNLDTKNAEKGFKKIKNSTEGVKESVEDTTSSAVKGTEAWNSSLLKLGLAGGGLAVVTMGLGKLTDMVQYSLEVSGEYDLAMQGLISTAEAYAQSTDEAKASAQELAKDGLMTVGQAAQTLKNLMGTGFNLEESLDLAKNMKDVGAFGNVVGDLGQAMTDASKGMKTGSIELIENIGLTQKLSTVMKLANVSTKDGINLTTDAKQRQALYNSVLAEGAKFYGNAEKLASTYSGSIAKLSAAKLNLANVYGKKFQPVAIKVNETLISIMDTLDGIDESSVKGAKDLKPFVDRLEELESKTELTKEEQEDLKNIMNEIATLSPTMVQSYDDQGNAIIGLANATKALNEMNKLEVIKRRDQLEEQKNDVEKSMADVLYEYEVFIGRRDRIMQLASADEQIFGVDPLSDDDKVALEAINRKIRETGFIIDQYKNNILGMTNEQEMLNELLHGSAEAIEAYNTKLSKNPIAKMTDEEIKESKKTQSEYIEWTNQKRNEEIFNREKEAERQLELEKSKQEKIRHIEVVNQQRNVEAWEKAKELELEKEEEEQASFERELSNLANNEQKRMEFLENAHFKRDALRQDELIAEEEAEKKSVEMSQKFASINRAITQKALAGELKGIEDLRDVVLKQVQADAFGKTIQLTTTGIVETVLSLASGASGNVAGATAHANAATTAFAGVPQVATIAGISTGLLGGVGGGEGVTDVNDGTVSQTQEIEANAQDQTPTLSLNVGDSNVLQALIPELDQALKDKWNVSIISK